MAEMKPSTLVFGLLQNMVLTICVLLQLTGRAIWSLGHQMAKLVADHEDLKHEPE